MSTPIQVVETFVSLQGEGPSAGEPAIFLRLANCNLNCVWCDTRHSWDWTAYDKAEEVDTVPFGELRDRILSLLPSQVHLLVLTGGEPLLHQAAIVPLLRSLRERRSNLRFEVETNGTIAPSPSMREIVHLFVVSPKLRNSAVSAKRRMKPAVLSEFARTNAVLKLVVDNAADIPEAAEVARIGGFTHDRVWVMPQTTSASDLGPSIANLAPAAIEAGFRVSARLHILAWGNTPGT